MAPFNAFDRNCIMHDKTVTVSIAELAAKLAEIGHAMPISFSALTDARAKKTGNPFGEIRKLERVLAFVGADYSLAVERQQDRENSTGNPFEEGFKSAGRSWGKRVAPALVEKDGQFYLRAKVERKSKPVYLVKKTAMGKDLPFLTTIPREVVAFLLPDEEKEIQREKTRQRVERAIKFRDYALRNIVSATFGGMSLRVRH